MEREGEGEGRREVREMRGRGRRGGVEKRRGIIMALFLGISFLLMSCGNAGPVPKEGQAATADGTILNLKAIGDNINGVVDFVMNIKEVKSLISSIDELAKGIGKKIESSGVLGADSSHGNNKNNGLMAGVYQIASDIVTKVSGLKVGESFKDKDLEAKVGAVKDKAEAFKSKLAAQHNDLGSSGAVQDTNAKQAIDRVTNGKSGTHGAKELAELYEAVDALLNTAKEILGGIIAPAKEVTPALNKE